MNAQAVIGGNAQHAAFEFGTGRHNVKSYRRPVTLDGALNRGYNLPPGFPDNATQAVVGGTSADGTADDASIAARGILEGVVPGDLIVDALRLKLVQQNVRIRRNPRQIVTFEPISQIGGSSDILPVYGTDYSVGDIVPFRAKINVSGAVVTRIDALMRVFAVDWNIDDEGNAQPSITVTSDI